MTGPKPGRFGGTSVDEPGELCRLSDFCIIIGAPSVLSAAAWVPTGGVRAKVPAGDCGGVFAARPWPGPGEQLEGSPECECVGILHAGVCAASEVLRGLECGESGVLGSENDTCMRSPDRCLCTDATGGCVRLAACISSASAKMAFISTLRALNVRP
jgi:hypothetical protein